MPSGGWQIDGLDHDQAYRVATDRRQYLAQCGRMANGSFLLGLEDYDEACCQDLGWRELMAKVIDTIQVQMYTSEIFSRIERLAHHVATAPDDDAIKVLAAEVGEINADTDLKHSTEMHDGVLVVTFEARENLAKMLAAFEGPRTDGEVSPSFSC